MTPVGRALPLLVVLSGCAAPATGPAPETAVVAPAPAASASAPSPARFVFVDVTEDAGLAGFRHVSGGADKLHLLESIGGGVAWIDHDGDGDLDAYLTNGASFEPLPQEPRDALFRNDGGRFTDVSAEAGVGDAGWTMGATAADYDGDGWTDLHLTGYGGDVLLRNEGGRFRDVTREAGLGHGSWTTGACFFDGDGDGDLDLFASAYMTYAPGDVPASTEYCEYRGVMVAYGPRGMKGARDVFSEQVSPGRFRDATERLAIDPASTYGFQPVAFDADGDADTDLFVANDSVANHLWLAGEGRFTEGALRAGVAMKGSGDAQACMGATLGDPNGDGRPDLLVTNFSEDYNTLYRNDGRGFFTDATHGAKLSEPALASLGWGCAFFDPDLDGDQDLIVANGHVYPQVDRFDFGFTYAQRAQAYENDGTGRFEDVTDRAGPGLQARRAHRGLAVGDFDGDGDDDVLLGVLDAGPVLLRNDSPRHGSWLAVELRDPTTRVAGIGATVVVRAGSRVQAGVVQAGTSFCSSSDRTLRFGLGDAAAAETVTVTWPWGETEVFRDVPGNARAVLVRGTGER